MVLGILGSEHSWGSGSENTVDAISLRAAPASLPDSLNPYILPCPDFSLRSACIPSLPYKLVNMLSEWQRATSCSVAEGGSQQPNHNQALLAPISPTCSERGTQPTLQKRSRALADVDGDHSDTRQRKKRRLRRELITSRLSRPYASPATHIISRNAVKLGIWTGRRYIGRNAFRKAAILNSIRREKLSNGAEKKMLLPQETSLKATYERLDPDISSVRVKTFREIPSSHTSVGLPVNNRVRVSSPPSPPVTTNYDVFDEEDSDSDTDDGGSVNIFDGAPPDLDDSDELYPFDEISMATMAEPYSETSTALDHSYQTSQIKGA